MFLLNFALGIALGLVVLLLLFWVERKWLKIGVILLSLVCVAVGMQLSQSYLSPYYLTWEFETDIKKEPLFKLIAKQHPKEFKAFMGKVKQNYLHQGDAAELSLYVQQLVNQVYFQHLEHAPDDYIFLYVKATQEMYQYLYQRSPIEVIHFENGQTMLYSSQMQQIAQDKLFQKLFSRLLDTKRYVIEASLDSPQTVPTKEEAAPILQVVLDRLVAKYGENAKSLLFTPPGPDAPVDQVAKLILEFYNEIIASGEKDTGIMIRYMASLREKAEAK